MVSMTNTIITTTAVIQRKSWYGLFSITKQSREKNEERGEPTAALLETLMIFYESSTNWLKLEKEIGEIFVTLLLYEVQLGN